MEIPRNILAIDYGGKRVGLAIANGQAKLSRPLVTIENSPDLVDQLQNIIEKDLVDVVVVGLPRNLSGLDTQQTKIVQDFAEDLKSKLDKPIYFEDETLSSVRVKEAATKTLAKEEVDSLAACYILDDFIANHSELFNV